MIWIIGLSGAGKTTLAEKVVEIVSESRPNVVLMDGDVIRETFGNDLGHSLDDRRRNAERMMRLCRWLDGQNIHVVCAILSLFPEHREWMRAHVRDYLEVYVDAPLDQLQARDGKGLYGRYARGEISDVAGLDLDFPVPVAPDVTISNAGSESDLLGHAGSLAARIVRT